jgi:hypothetical protein
MDPKVLPTDRELSALVTHPRQSDEVAAKNKRGHSLREHRG